MKKKNYFVSVEPFRSNINYEKIPEFSEKGLLVILLYYIWGNEFFFLFQKKKKISSDSIRNKYS